MSSHDLERYAVLFSAKGHTIKRTPDGHVDDYGFFYFDDPDAEASDEHCGPICVTCGYGFCMFCDEIHEYSNDIPICSGASDQALK